jgi:O-antigen/teichoic acid export membrane protein
MFTWVTKILQLAGRDGISVYEDLLFKRGFTVLLVQFGGLVFAFISNILLARLYGEQVYGIYSLISSWTILLSVIAVFGMDDVHLVQVPGMKLKNEKNNIIHLLRWSVIVNGVTIFIVIAAFYFVINFFSVEHLSENALYFNFSVGIVCLSALLTNFICFLRGLDRVVPGEIVDKILRPLFFSILLVIFFYVQGIDPIIRTIIASSTGLFFVVAALLFTIYRSLRKMKPGNSSAKKNFSLVPNIRYVFLNLSYFLATRIDILILGILSSVIMVGHYNVALRFADIFAYPIAIVNLSMPTLLSRERHDKNEEAASLILYRVSKNSFYQCLLLGILFLIAAHWILQWYGKGFTDAFPVLFIFLLSNLISASTGSTDVFFIMQRQEKKVIYSRIIALIVTILLALKLIPLLDIMGAAISTLAGNFIYCVLLQYFFFKKYGFIIHPFHQNINGN